VFFSFYFYFKTVVLSVLSTTILPTPKASVLDPDSSLIHGALGLHKGLHATREASIPQNRTSSISEHEIS
jgi:hypothetical protein